jgi:hypothetical protein
METFGERDELQLGSASILFLHDSGSGVYTFQESVTVDRSSSDNNEISAMNQKQYVLRDVRTNMDSSLIAYVPDSVEVGVSIIRSTLAALLTGYIGRGIIAPYTDDSGNERPIDPNIDIEVVRDRTDRTLYHFKYWFNIRYGIKRLFGLYSADRRFWGRV